MQVCNDVACVAGEISRASAFVLVAKPLTASLAASLAGEGIWRLRRSPAHESRQLRRLVMMKTVLTRAVDRFPCLVEAERNCSTYENV